MKEWRRSRGTCTCGWLAGNDSRRTAVIARKVQRRKKDLFRGIPSTTIRKPHTNRECRRPGGREEEGGAGSRHVTHKEHVGSGRVSKSKNRLVGWSRRRREDFFVPHASTQPNTQAHTYSTPKESVVLAPQMARASPTFRFSASQSQATN